MAIYNLLCLNQLGNGSESLIICLMINTKILLKISSADIKLSGIGVNYSNAVIQIRCVDTIFLPDILLCQFIVGERFVHFSHLIVPAHQG